MRLTRKQLLIAGAILFSLLLCSGILVLMVSLRGSVTRQVEFGSFASCAELAANMTGESQIYPYGGVATPEMLADTDATISSSDGGEKAGYSLTNVQVAGVDEADSLKTDGNFVYLISQGQVSIVDITKPAELEELATIDLTETATSLFLKGDKLVVFASDDRYYPYPVDTLSSKPGFWSPSRQSVALYIYDVSDPAAPELTRTVKLDGSYQSARMIGDSVYLVANHYTGAYGEVSPEQAQQLLPQIADVAGDAIVKEADFQRVVECDQVSEFAQEGTTFVSVVAIDIAQGGHSQKVVLGAVNNIYMSEDNLYLSSTVYDYNTPDPIVCDPLHQAAGLCPAESDIAHIQPEVSTYLGRISLADGLEYAATGEVPGIVLNQFSMDENSGYLRIATTENDFFGWDSESTSNLFVLNEALEVVGSVSELAAGEQIYSVRFLGDRGYIVTYKTIDPLFVLDLSQPTSPRVLGELKIPGFSTYLHPYDENHILGFGRDSLELDSDRAIQQGLKFALFDVTDPSNPLEVDAEIVGGRGSDSVLLNDHKALLFDREQNLLVVPAIEYADSDTAWDYGEETFRGFIVYRVNLTDGIVERGRIEREVDYLSSYYYWDSYNYRSFFSGVNLFTWGEGVLEAHNLTSLQIVGVLNR